MTARRKPPTWSQVEQVSKHSVALTLLVLEVWRWGARPQVLTAMLAILGVSEAARLIVKSRGGNGQPVGSTGEPSSLSRSQGSSHG